MNFQAKTIVLTEEHFAGRYCDTTDCVGARVLKELYKEEIEKYNLSVGWGATYGRLYKDVSFGVEAVQEFNAEKVNSDNTIQYGFYKSKNKASLEIGDTVRIVPVKINKYIGQQLILE